MAYFSNVSKERLSTCDKRLQEICNIAIKIFDFSVICGHRGEEKQNECYKNGTSKVKYPNSKHNKAPSYAVDLVPWDIKNKRINWENIDEFYKLAYIIFGIAATLDIKIVWGGNWKSLVDYPHFQLGE